MYYPTVYFSNIRFVGAILFYLPSDRITEIVGVSKHKITMYVCVADDVGNYDKRYHQMAIIICTKADLLFVKISR